MRIAIQGFGSVGKAVARYLSENGAIIIAVSDTKGTIYNSEALSVKELVDTKLFSGELFRL